MEDNIVQIIGFDSIIKLNTVASIFWQMANGSNSMGKIVDYIFSLFDGVSWETIFEDIYEVALDLNKKGIMEINWDPIFKYKIWEKEEESL